jgi:superfamily I DNA/RNA helicase
MFMHKVKKVFGPPGTGKTTKLISEVVQALSAGISPEQIGYFSFTNKATEEAKNRISEKYKDLDSNNDFSGFRTLHSLAFQCLPSRLKIMSKEEALAFDKEFLIETVYMRENDPLSLVYRAKQIVVDAAATARARCISFDSYLELANASERYRLKRWLTYEPKSCDQNFSKDDIDRLLDYNSRYEAYKSAIGVIDYTSILEEVLKTPDALPSYDLLIIDEAQDLSELQWRIADVLIKKAGSVFVAGDDDQAICESFGADPSRFIALEGDEEVLSQSHRIPIKVHQALFRNYGVVSKLARFFRERRDKSWSPKAIDGAYEKIDGVSQLLHKVNDYISWSKFPMAKDDPKDFLIMAATNGTLQQISKVLEAQSIPHFLSNRYIGHKSGENSSDIKLMTIWGAKGGQAKVCVLVRGNYVDEKMLTEDPRLEYVAITRTQENFYVCRL